MNRQASSTYVRVKLLSAGRKNVKSDLVVIKRLECARTDMSITRRPVSCVSSTNACMN